MRSVQADRPAVEVSAIVSDPYDGMIRLLNDVQRFGLSIVRIGLQEHAEGSAASLMLAGDRSVDCAVLQARLERHPCLRRLQVLPAVAAGLPHAA